MYPAMTRSDGPSRVNPIEGLSAQVPMTSLRMASASRAWLISRPLGEVMGHTSAIPECSRSILQEMSLDSLPSTRAYIQTLKQIGVQGSVVGTDLIEGRLQVFGRRTQQRSASRGSQFEQIALILADSQAAPGLLEQ